MNALKYTNEELEKQLNLLEIHLKQTSYDKEFCQECMRKHLLTIEGLAEEGIGFSDDPEKYAEIAQLTKEIRDKNIGNAIETAKKIRQIRKSLIEECPNCKTLPKSEIENLTKDLNNPSTFNNYLNISNKKKMEYTDLAYMNAGQFAAEGIRYLAETNATLMPYEKYVSIGGGLGLQILGLFVKKLPKVVKQISLVTGSNLLANGVVKLVKGVVTPTATVRAVAPPMTSPGVGRTFSYAPTFGGPTFGGRITAENVPTRYARAGILSGAQAFEAPEHADLIRVD